MNENGWKLEVSTLISFWERICFCLFLSFFFGLHFHAAWDFFFIRQRAEKTEKISRNTKF